LIDDQLHLQWIRLIALEVLQRPAVPREPEREVSHLAGSLHVETLLRTRRSRLHLSERDCHTGVAGSVNVGDVPIPEAQPLDHGQCTGMGLVVCHRLVRLQLPVGLPLLGRLQSDHGLDQLDHREHKAPLEERMQVNTAGQAADVYHIGLFAPCSIRHPHLLGPNQRCPAPVHIQRPLDHHRATKGLARLAHHIAFNPAPI
jgi:hypothetical protein